jgi:urease accessory protein
MATADGWGARLALEFAPRAGRTVLARKHQHGPLTVQRAFYPEGAPCHLYLLHPPGGVVGGDRLEITAEVRPGAHALLTAPGAAKFYRSVGPVASLQQRLLVEDGAMLEWLPPESILFPGARFRQQLRVSLQGSARFIGWEIVSLGRPVIGERFEDGMADLGLRIERDGRPLLTERLRFGSEAAAASMRLDAAAGLRGWPVTATLVAVGADAADLAAALASLPPASCGGPIGITLLDDLLIARALTHRVEPALHAFRAIWQTMRPRLLGLEASTPRIWAT